MKTVFSIKPFVCEWIFPNLGIYFFSALLLATLWGGTIWQIHNERTSALSQVAREGEKFTRAFEEHIRQVLKTNDQYLIMVKNMFESSDSVSPAIFSIVEQISRDPLVNQFALVGADGRLQVSSCAYPPNLNVSDMEHFTVHAPTDTEKLYISKPATSRASQNQTILLSRRINHPDGSFAGIVALSISPDYFSSFYRSMNFDDNYSVRFVGIDGVIRAANNSYEIGVDLTNATIMSEAAKNSSGFYKTKGAYFGKPRLMFYRVMEDYPLIVQVGVSEESLYFMQQHRKTYVFTAFGISIFIFCFTVGLAILARKQRKADKLIKKQHEEIANDVRLAGTVQRALLPGNYDDERITIRTIYQPAKLVSGDTFGYRWNKDGKTVNGFVADATGHGITAALQTAAINAIFEEEMGKEENWSIPVLEHLNIKLQAYLAENSFAASMIFSVDYGFRQLTCATGGINYFLASSENICGWATLPGSYIGIMNEAFFESITINFRTGDNFYFMTDGLYEQIMNSSEINPTDFEAVVDLLTQVALRSERRDDCSAICIRING